MTKSILYETISKDGRIRLVKKENILQGDEFITIVEYQTHDLWLFSKWTTERIFHTDKDAFDYLYSKIKL